MATRKEERLKKLIKAVPPEAPAPAFTERVMGDVRAVIGPEAAMDPGLGALLRKSKLEMPSAHFTQLVMKEVMIAGRATPARAPIIPVWILYGIVATLAGLVVWVTVAGSAAGPPRAETFWSVAVRTVFGAISAVVQAVPAFYVLIVVVVSVLLGIEYLLRYGSGGREESSRIAGQ